MELIQEFSEIAVYKLNTQKSIVCLNIIEINMWTLKLKTHHHLIIRKMKYFCTNLITHIQDLCWILQNADEQMVSINGENSCVHELEEPTQ